MQIKSELRKALKAKRAAVDKKAEKDDFIRENLMCSDLYLDAKTILFYCAVDSEIDIDDCIADALLLGKRAALPVCINDRGDMEFYYINSFDDLNTGFFGVREPDVNKCERVSDLSNTICVVPAIAYDKKGYRLGYGKGYYDRFLQKNALLSIGLCYNELIEDELPIGEFDIPVDYIITESTVTACDKER